MHGDLGMVTRQDVILAVSNSGETEELTAILPAIKSLGARIVALTGVKDSTLGRAADLIIDTGVAREACPLGLAPTASTTAALAMGDALAVCLLTRRGFNEADFKARHPGGHLGARLSVKVREVMITGSALPLVGPQTPMAEAIGELDAKNQGHALVVDQAGKLKGILSDGDLRRALRDGLEVLKLRAGEMMIKGPKSIGPDSLALDALEMMERFQITALPIIDGQQRVVGLIHLHDILGRGRFSFRPLARGEGD
jgi:arabinose-5-phosphate isomerase